MENVMPLNMSDVILMIRKQDAVKFLEVTLAEKSLSQELTKFWKMFSNKPQLLGVVQIPNFGLVLRIENQRVTLPISLTDNPINCLGVTAVQMLSVEIAFWFIIAMSAVPAPITLFGVVQALLQQFANGYKVIWLCLVLLQVQKCFVKKGWFLELSEVHKCKSLLEIIQMVLTLVFVKQKNCDKP